MTVSSSPSVLRNQVFIEAAETQRIADVDVAGFQPIAEQPVHEELIFIGMDDAVAIPVLLVEVGFHPLRDECLRHLIEAVPAEALAIVEALSQKRDRLHQVVVLTVSGERQLEQQRSQMLFKRESERSDELPFDRCCIEAMGADVLRRPRKLCALQNAEGPPLDLAEGNRIGDAVVEEHAQNLPDMLDAFVAFLLEGEDLLLHALLGGGIHLADMVDQAVDQIVVDLPVALPQKAQEIEARHAGGQLLQLLYRVVIDERGIVSDAVVRDAQLR